MTSRSRRLLSLDVFRGITIAGMILVDCAGSSVVHPLLRHAAWNGWTLADLVFPSFLVIMGASLVISLSRRVARGESLPLLSFQIVRRTAVIFAFGLLISFFIFNPPAAGLRWPGVLQRIAVCYFVCALVYLSTGPALQAALCVLLLVGYWLLLTRVPVPGYGAGVLTPQGCLSCYVDRTLLGPHMWYGAYCDPEGILSTIPALADALLGLLAGHWLISRGRTHVQKARRMAAAGALAVAAGLLWSRWFPMNKHVWTSSYALFAGGLALMGLSACYWAIEIREVSAWGRPFEIFGRNPLLSYFLSGLFYGVQQFLHPSWAGGLSLERWINARVFASWLSPMNASLAYAAAYLLVCLAGMSVLHRKKLFLKF
jgi:predicted acyltransferase